MRKLGIIHFDRHVDTQAHRSRPSACTQHLVSRDEHSQTCRQKSRQVGIGGWQSPRPGVKVGRDRQTTIMTVTDCVEMGIENAAKRALEVAWTAPTRLLSFDVDVWMPPLCLELAGRNQAGSCARSAEVPSDHRDSSL